MFTGIVEERGRVESIISTGDSSKIKVSCKKVIEPPTRKGDSISVNGVCLTATDITEYSFTADVMPETFRMSSLEKLRRGSFVNLERAVSPTGRLGGHIVSGHIDGTGTILSIARERNAVWFKIGMNDELLNEVVYKGSIAIDGISLTVAEKNEGSFSVSIIPHTLSVTSLVDRKPGDIVNIETDILGKYVKSFISKFMNDNADNDFHPAYERKKSQAEVDIMIKEFLEG